MRIAATVILALIVLAAARAEPVSAQPEPQPLESTIFGYVVDQSTGQQIIGATVEFPEFDRQVITDSNGAFALMNVPRGHVAVRVRHLGFADYDDELDIATETVTLTIALGAQPVILEGITARAYGFGDRLRTRRRMTAVSVRAIERDQLSLSTASDGLRALLDRGALRRTSCRSDDTFAICVSARGRAVQPSVYIDERPALGGLSELETYRPDELYAIEVYQGGRHVRVYTTWWVEMQAHRDRPMLHPVVIW